MFTNDQRQKERTGKYGTSRQQHLQNLVTQFQTPNLSPQTKLQILSNLSNFSYDPYNFLFLRHLNVLELFLDCLSDPDERFIEFAVGGLCNAAVDPENAKVIANAGGVEALVGCLLSPVRNVVRYAIAGLFYMCENKEVCDVREVYKEEVVELVRKFSDGGDVCVPFRNLAKVLLEKHLLE